MHTFFSNFDSRGDVTFITEMSNLSLFLKMLNVSGYMHHKMTKNSDKMYVSGSLAIRYIFALKHRLWVLNRTTFKCIL